MDWRPLRRSSPASAFPAPRRASTVIALAAAASMPLATSARAGVITDKSFFTSLPSTIIDFETNGAGAELGLIDGQSLTMPTSAYQSAGVLFSTSIAWVNDGGIDFDIAQFLGGSPDVGIPGAADDTFTILFTVPVRSVALFVVNTHIVDDSGPVFTARDGGGNVLEMVTFGNETDGSQFVDGRVGTADYGFMGIFSETLIASLTISKDAAMFDDLTFSSEVPAPAAIVVFSVGAAVLGRRSRRS